MTDFWGQYPKIKEKLALVQSELAATHKTSLSYLDESFDYLLSSGGKMLRPAFVFIGAGLQTPEDEQKIMNVAVAIETLHMATLIHDDIVDDSRMRRGKLSIQAKYSKEYAVYMGDFLFTQIFMMLAKYDYSRENLYDISRAVSKMCIGEMLQSKLRFKTDVRTRDYLKVVAGKTAALFAVSLGMGAHLAGVEEKLAKTMARIGYNIGMAFQIKDDLLDYNGDLEQVGKDTMADLANGYYTLPVIYALRSDNAQALEVVLKDFNSSEVQIEQALKLIKGSNGIRDAESLANKYLSRANKAIDTLPDGETKSILKDLVPLLMHRDK